MVRVSVIGETLPAVERKDGERAPTVEPRCQHDGCAGLLVDTGRTQGTASAGVLVDLRCPDCGQHSWWRAVLAYEYLLQDIQL